MSLFEKLWFGDYRIIIIITIIASIYCTLAIC